MKGQLAECQGFASGGRLALNQPHSKLFTEA